MESLEEKTTDINYSKLEKLENMSMSIFAAISMGIGIPFILHKHYVTGLISAAIAIACIYGRYENYKHSGS